MDKNRGVHQFILQPGQREIPNDSKNMFPILIHNKKKGIAVVEILIVIGIIAIVMSSLLGVVVFSLKLSASVKETTMADALAQEMIEAVRNFRDGTDWDGDGLGVLSTGSLYHPEESIDVPPAWTLVGGEETIDGFTRKVVFERVSRDPTTNNIEDVYNPGNDDPDARKVIATVSWESRKVEIITYFTNWR